MGKLKLLILILLFVSCSQSPKESVIQQQNLSSVSIPIDFDEEIRQGIKLSELVENIEFVSLEVTDDCLLRGVDHAEVTDEYIYVVDKPDHRSPCVYQFDRKGHFLRRIGSQGEGPEEFIQMRGFALNVETEEIYIYDGVRKRVLSYLPDGTFSKVINMRQDCRNFVYQNGLYYLYDPDTEEKGNKVFVKDENGNKLSDYLKNDDLGCVFSKTHVVRTVGSGVLFYEAFNDTIYTFDQEIMKVKYVFEFGQYAMPLNKKREYMEAIGQNRPLEYQIQLLGNYITDAFDIRETEKWLFFKVVKENLLYHGIYDKITKKICLQNVFKDDLYEVTGLGDEFVGVTSGRLIASVNANRIKNAFEKY